MTMWDLLASLPRLEVLIRHVYWRNPRLKGLLGAIRRNPQPRESLKRVDEGRIWETLRDLGVKRGDILVVHSDYAQLRRTEKTPAAIVESLRGVVGPEGTLGMPTIPLLRGEPSGHDRLVVDVSSLVLEYDPRRAPAATGALPNALLMNREAVRSLHPLNTMGAIGAEAKDMVQSDLDGDRPLPCGVQSAWYYCYKRNAKVVALGVDMAHSLTMIHVAEDANEERWTPRGWYRDRHFRIKCAGNERSATVRERHPRWAMYFAERRMDRDLRRAGIIVGKNVGGIRVDVAQSRPLVDYLAKRGETGYPYYCLPRL